MAAARKGVHRRREHRAEKIVEQVLLRVERIIRIQLEHPSLTAHDQGRAPLDEFMHAADTQRQQSDCDPKPPAGEPIKPPERAKQNETGHNAEVKMHEKIELNAQELSPVKAE